MEYQRFKYKDIFKVDSVVNELTNINTSTNQKKKKQIYEKPKGIFQQRPAPRRFGVIRFFGKSVASVPKGVSIKPAKILTRVPVKIGDVSIGPEINILDSDKLSGISIVETIGLDVSGYIENGVLIIKGFYK